MIDLNQLLNYKGQLISEKIIVPPRTLKSSQSDRKFSTKLLANAAILRFKNQAKFLK